VSPPVHIKVEYGTGASNLEELKKEIEALLNARLNFRAAVNLVPEGSLPRFEMKAQLIKKLWENP
jgi:phenylacetate-CoA ligase